MTITRILSGFLDFSRQDLMGLLATMDRSRKVVARDILAELEAACKLTALLQKILGKYTATNAFHGVKIRLMLPNEEIF